MRIIKQAERFPHYRLADNGPTAPPAPSSSGPAAPLGSAPASPGLPGLPSPSGSSASGSGLSSAVSFAQGANGTAYGYGTNSDCSGVQSGIYNALTGKDVRFSTDSNFGALGFQPGYDPNSSYNIGTNGQSGEAGHMAGELSGVPVESASATGHHPGGTGVMYGGDAYGPTNPIFTEQFHLPNSYYGG